MGFVALRPMKIRKFNTGSAKAIAVGEAHTLVLDIKGNVYSFGWAEDGQLGLPENYIKDSIMTT
jgi:alpha-tubulin suppressor-like RCC1 family protein